jgi:glycerol-3-phosphate acyltransferase PlsY
MTILVVFGILAALATLTGAYSLYLGTSGTTEVAIFGGHLGTTSVGVALIGIGLVVALLSSKSVLKSMADLASLPFDQKKRDQRDDGDSR